jgi:ER membrane protein complex subunit 4
MAISSSSSPEWVLRLTNPSNPNRSKSTTIPDPPGYTSTTTSKSRSKANPSSPIAKAPTPEETDTLKVKKAWELAIGPAKQLPMNAIGMYMTGSGLQIFSIMMVFMLFKTPITAVLGLNGAFERYETEGTRDRLLLAKAVYVLTNGMLLALGIWKVNQMGLLPTTRSDWLLWEMARVPAERAVMG